jgi:glycosyltransferase involved in cell wall biosynthesis
MDQNGKARKKLLYLCTYDLTVPTSIGASKKIRAQRRVFSSYFEVSYTCFENGRFVIRNEEGVQQDLGKPGFPGRVQAVGRLADYCRLPGNCPDLMYFRYTQSDPNVLRFLKLLQERGSTALLEIPTWPYEKEYCDNFPDYMSLQIDRLCRGQLKKYVHVIYSYGAVPDRIFGIPTCTLQNGIDLEDLPERVPVPHGETVSLIAVAVFADWHGYDRFLAGMGEYYRNGGSRDIHLDLVGGGPALEGYRELVSREKLEEHVTFQGFRSGRELDRLYDRADIAISTLGCHRKGIYGSISSLKDREYGAKGLPVITSTEIDIFPSAQYDFILKVPDNDSPVAMKEVLAFADRMKEQKDLSGRIRALTAEKSDIGITMQPVIREFLGNEQGKAEKSCM